jgi:hypothetical protein
VRWKKSYLSIVNEEEEEVVEYYKEPSRRLVPENHLNFRLALSKAFLSLPSRSRTCTQSLN